METKKIIADMVISAVEASKLIKEIYLGDFDVTYKDDASPLTSADIASNTAIVSRLRTAYPDISILSEEEDDSGDRLVNENGVFIIDPLDGTKEFVNRNGEFCVSIAHAVSGRVVAGVVAVPMRDEIYYAVRDNGAYKADFAAVTGGFYYGVGKKLSASSRTEEIILAVSRSQRGEETEKLLLKNKERIASVVTLGSCLKGCLIAEGKVDAYYCFGAGTKEWDTAGMQIICEEAGALFTDIYGYTLKANREDPYNRSGFIILNRKESALNLSGII